MGDEAYCTARIGGKASKGKALLESEELIFRGDFRWSIAFNRILSIEARDGQLRLTSAEEKAVFELGTAAEKWAFKIRNPRGLLDKLGVKPDSDVVVLDVDDQDFRAQMDSRTSTISWGKLRKNADIVFLGAGKTDALKKLGPLEGSIKKNGAIWVIYPKGQDQIRQSDVMAAAKAAGLVDTKVVSFSKNHTALKLVIPLDRRSREGG